MSDGIRVRIIPGCPGIIIAETEEDKELAKAALANTKCGCIVKSEADIAELTEAEVEEAEEVAGISEEAKAEEAESLAELAEEAPVCSLEPQKPWEESVCGVVAKEAGRQAADEVMVRLREEGLIA